ncbi:BlaI/MecI/CopY family transcriptional regulator [Haliscomenobacter hydrossis]|uniref:Transcriptional repressor, CopY family n=1 Tax=Haliscomenobacter hydrossis (strain ATCC 27775 / DSM 1100 / LMG 10767 / O) TaxID=760192 RepID=F4KRV1_HALH1|nr:BlaI/MecI/CopY family transcriptional regulator [Haliscomenobacter hydrossis]AEE50055.1 transcriptional repressor, CopY family [Haliscomenobacter hydrossis DSM 1100]
MQLSKTEEQVMEYLWKLEKAYMKDLIDAFPDPKPASTTVATLLKRMQDKGAVGYTVHGNSREYYPLIGKNDYFAKQVKGMINNFFEGSTTQFASFFTSATDMSAAELEDLRKLVDQEIKKKRS